MEELLRGCLKIGRDRFAFGHAECASRLLGAAASGCSIPQRSGEWNENTQANEMLGNHAMDDHSHPILADLPELGSLHVAIFQTASEEKIAVR